MNEETYKLYREGYSKLPDVDQLGKFINEITDLNGIINLNEMAKLNHQTLQNKPEENK
jgi:hypothetical protein